MRSSANLETTIANLEHLVSLVSPDHPKYLDYILAKNIAAKAIRGMQTLKIKKIRKQQELHKKRKKENDADGT